MLQGMKIYFHRIVLEDEDEITEQSPSSKQIIFFKCQIADRRRFLLNRTKRAANSQFPFELVEPE